MIYDGGTCHANGTSTSESIAVASQAYNPTYNASYYVGWTQNESQRTNSTTATASNAKSKIESWYSSNITGTNASKVADGKYCNDRNVKTGQSWAATGSTFYYAGYERLIDNKNPTFSCPSGDVYTLKVGLITADEVAFAGGVWETNNTSYYLYNGNHYWTMSPGIWNGAVVDVFAVDSYGYLSNSAGVSNSSLGLRPIINLLSDTTFSSGNGTQNSPYVVS